MPAMPAVHPAVPITAHLVPGIKDWANHAIATLANPGNALKGVDFSIKGLENWYIHTDPLHSLLTFSSFLAIAVFLLGEVTTNWSSVDRIWAALPVLYSGWLCFHGHFTGAGSIKSLFSSKSASSFSAGRILPFVPKGVDERMFLVFILQCVWSARLTGNTLRRGFFNPAEEDYRWPIVRRRLPRWFWPIMNFSFVSVIQIILLACTALPQYLLLTSTRAYHPAHPSTPFGYPDVIVAGLFLLNLTIEQIADSQQQAFQNWKHATPLLKAQKNAGKSPREVEVAEGSLKRGFLTAGLWSWTRHPNFLCEQINFWILPLFTIVATVPRAVFVNIYENFKMSLHLSDHTYLLNSLKSSADHLVNYSWIIAVAMSVLFRSSTILTEAISSGKYPKYRDYQRRVGMFLPSTTILKGIWLAVTGRLSSTNEQVYGATLNSKKKSKSKKQ